MSDVDFNEPQYARAVSRGKGSSWMSRLVISWGLAKNEAGAQKVLASAAIIIALIAIGVYLFG